MNISGHVAVQVFIQRENGRVVCVDATILIERCMYLLDEGEAALYLILHKLVGSSRRLFTTIVHHFLAINVAKRNQPQLFGKQRVQADALATVQDNGQSQVHRRRHVRREEELGVVDEQLGPPAQANLLRLREDALVLMHTHLGDRTAALLPALPLDVRREDNALREEVLQRVRQRRELQVPLQSLVDALLDVYEALLCQLGELEDGDDVLDHRVAQLEVLRADVEADAGQKVGDRLIAQPGEVFDLADALERVALQCRLQIHAVEREPAMQRLLEK